MEVAVSEYTIGWLATAKLGFVGLWSTLYWLGGRHHKVLRRYVGGLLFPTGLVGIGILQETFQWWHLAGVAAYPAVLSMGYGGLTLDQKLIRRARYGLLLGLCGLLYVSAQTWPLGLFQVVVAVMASVVLGIVNPVEAAEEEALIATLSVLCVPFLL